MQSGRSSFRRKDGENHKILGGKEKLTSIRFYEKLSTTGPASSP